MASPLLKWAVNLFCAAVIVINSEVTIATTRRAINQLVSFQAAADHTISSSKVTGMLASSVV